MESGNWHLLLGEAATEPVINLPDAAVTTITGASALSALSACWIGPDLDGAGLPDLLCYSNPGDLTYIHLVEDTDLDGDLWSVLDCDADDNDPLVH